jgi:hypothetical protein
MVDSERARGLGRRSGQTRRKLTLDRVEQELGPVETEQDAKRRLERLGVWCAAGLLSGSQRGAAVRSLTPPVLAMLS